MKKCILFLLLLLLGACAQKTATQADGHESGQMQAHGQMQEQGQMQGHGQTQDQGHGHGKKPARQYTGIPDHFPATPQQDPSLKGRVYTLSSYFTKTYEDLKPLSPVAQDADKAALQSMISEGRVMIAPKASSVVIEDAFTPESDVPVVKFRFMHGGVQGFTYKSFLYEFQPNSM